MFNLKNLPFISSLIPQSVTLYQVTVLYMECIQQQPPPTIIITITIITITTITITNNSMVSVCLVNSSFDLVISSMQSANEKIQLHFFLCGWYWSCVGGTGHVWAVLMMCGWYWSCVGSTDYVWAVLVVWAVLIMCASFCYKLTSTITRSAATSASSILSGNPFASIASRRRHTSSSCKGE